MTKTKIKIVKRSPEEELFEEIVAELPSVDGITDELSYAEGCENLDDLAANLEAARDAAQTLTAELQELISQLNDRRQELEENEDD